MKYLKKYEDIYGPGWTSTTTGSEPAPDQPQPQPELFTTHLKIPVFLTKEPDENLFDNDDVEYVARQLEDQGFESDWLVDQFKRWKEYAGPEDVSDSEPNESDFEDEDDYNAEWEEWNARNEEREEWEESDEHFREYVDEEWNGNWSKFMEEFKIEGLVEDVADRSDQLTIFDHIMDDWNDADLVQWFDEAKELGIQSMKVTDDEGFDNNCFTVEIKSTKPLENDDIDTVINYVEGQCSDGWGEGFEQNPILDYNVHTWWNESEFNVPYEIVEDLYN